MAAFRVVILDDSEVVQQQVAEALMGAGLHVDATDSWYALCRFIASNQPPDLLLLDLQMPRFSGVAVARAVRRRFSIPIIVYSSEAQESLERLVHEKLADAVLNKSKPISELVTLINSLLSTTGEGRKVASATRSANATSKNDL